MIVFVNWILIATAWWEKAIFFNVISSKKGNYHYVAWTGVFSEKRDWSVEVDTFAGDDSALLDQRSVVVSSPLKSVLQRAECRESGQFN
ncbi:hypothetical protein ABGT18_04995 [Pseudomonas putida]|uniref:hypothetical protein n=1 Tax=Pseudomonas putida TaxID=303 RepID=UPI00345D4905